MKKRKSFLTIISSLFGVVAICGLSMFSILEHKKENTKVEALQDYFVLQQDSGSLQHEYVNLLQTTSTMDGDYNIKYVNNFTENKYYFLLDCNFYFENGAYTFWNGNLYNPFYFSAQLLPHTTELTSRSHFRVRMLSTELTPNSSVTKDIRLKINFVFERYNLRPGSSVANVVESVDFDYTFLGKLYDGSTLVNPYQSSRYQDFVYYNITDNIYYFIDYQVDVNVDDLDISYQNGYYDGYNVGYSDGQSVGFNDGYLSGYVDGSTNGYSLGYADGYDEGFNADSTATTIITGIFQVALVPVNFFLGIFNFEILGINLSSLVRAIFTIAITILVMKYVTGKGD